MYTPPELPSHFPTNLQSVLGAPSDEELQNVQAAVRAYEHFVHSKCWESVKYIIAGFLTVNAWYNLSSIDV